MTTIRDDILLRWHSTDYHTALAKARDEFLQTGFGRYVVRRTVIDGNDFKFDHFEFCVVDRDYIKRQDDIVMPIVAIFETTSDKYWRKEVTHTSRHSINELPVEYEGSIDWPIK